MAFMECQATDGNGHIYIGLPEHHTGRHLDWTGSPIGQRQPVMWHDERTRAQAEQMRAILTRARSTS